MKRSISIVLALIMLLTLFSCASKKTGIIDPSDTTAPAENTPPATTEATPPPTTEAPPPPPEDDRVLMIREESGCGYPHDRVFRNPIVTFLMTEYDGDYGDTKTVKIGNKSYSMELSSAFYYPFNDRVALEYSTKDRNVKVTLDKNEKLTSISATGIDNYVAELDIPEDSDDQAVISAVKELLSPHCDIGSYEFKRYEELDNNKVRYAYLIEQDGVVFFKVSFLVQNNKKLINFAFAPYASGKVEKTSIDTELANELLKIKLEDVYLKEFPGKKITSVTYSEVYAVVYEEIEYIHFMGLRTTFEGEEVPYGDGNLGILIPLSMIEAK